MPARLQLYVIGHDADALQRVCSPLMIPHAAVDLNNLGLEGDLADNALAENRFYLSSLAESPMAQFVGLFTYRYDDKFRSLKTRLRDFSQTMSFQADTVYAPHVATADWLDISEGFHPGMTELLEQVAEDHDIPREALHRPAPWANNFIVAKEVYFDFLQDWRLIFQSLHDEYGLDLPYENKMTDYEPRKPGLVYERVSMMLLSKYKIEAIP